jgi:hypothetical protein
MADSNAFVSRVVIVQLVYLTKTKLIRLQESVEVREKSEKGTPSSIPQSAPILIGVGAIVGIVAIVAAIYLIKKKN